MFRMRHLRLFAILLASAWLAVTAHAVVYNLVAPSAPLAVGDEVRLNLLILNPSDTETTLLVTDTIEGRLAKEEKNWAVKLKAPAMGGPVTIKAGGFAVREYLVTLPDNAVGSMVLTINDPVLAKVSVETLSQIAEEAPVRAPLSNFVPLRTAENAIKRAFIGRFSAHEPTYFIYGDEIQAAKFQFSFRYRILGTEAGLSETMPALRGLYFGFTQRSLWEIEAESSPFYDTSYIPELIFESQAILEAEDRGGMTWLGYQVGLRHESNGQTGPTSRSMNTLYFRPGLSFGRLDGWNLIVAPRVSLYIADLSNNPDIETYRGNLELFAAFGRNDGPGLSVTGRFGKTGKVSLQTSLTIPLEFDHMFDFATYLLVQYWEGYGESLLDYNKQSSSIRVGFSLVR